jgi:hypothetical protein
MCFVRLWKIGFFAMATAPVLSHVIFVGFCWVSRNSRYKFCNHEASFPASHRAIYSASVEDCTVTGCLLDHQVIAPFAAMKTYPVVDFMSSLFWYAASENPLKEIAVSSAYLYVIPYVRIPDKYRNILFSAV